MKNSLKTLILGLGLISTVACQQVNPVSNQPSTPDQVDGNDVKLCSDGTLNCYVEFPPESEPFTGLNFNQTYAQCMDTCLPSTCTDGTGDLLEEAADECPTQFTACDAQCSITSEESPVSHLPDSDGLTLPQNAKAVLVEIEACYDIGGVHEIHMQGPEIHFVSPREGNRSVTKTGGFLNIGGTKRVRLGYDVGRNPYCPEELKNRVKVTYKPISETSITIGTKTITVVPFANAGAISKVQSLPHSMAFGLPSKIRDEVDFSETVWVPKSFGTPSPHISSTFNDWRYYNTDIPYGTTVAFAGFYIKNNFFDVLTGSLFSNPKSTAPIQKISVYAIIKSK